MGFNTREVAKAGRKVYERHRIEFERLHRGKYVLIDIRTEKVFLAESPEGAYRQAAAEHEEGPCVDSLADLSLPSALAAQRPYALQARPRRLRPLPHRCHARAQLGVSERRQLTCGERAP